MAPIFLFPRVPNELKGGIFKDTFEEQCTEQCIEIHFV